MPLLSFDWWFSFSKQARVNPGLRLSNGEQRDPPPKEIGYLSQEKNYLLLHSKRTRRESNTAGMPRNRSTGCVWLFLSRENS
jgi:hypothetical protein